VKAGAPIAKAAMEHIRSVAHSAVDGTRHAAAALFQNSEPTALVGTLAGKLALEGAKWAKLGLQVKEKPGNGDRIYVPAGKAAENGGSLTIPAGVRLTPDESKLAADLVHGGDTVEALRPSATGRTADFRVNGKETELKTLSDVRDNEVGNALTATVVAATKQVKK